LQGIGGRFDPAGEQAGFAFLKDTILLMSGTDSVKIA
jgi:hypothetical protein